jgi:hypothetical protein
LEIQERGAVSALFKARGAISFCSAGNHARPGERVLAKGGGTRAWVYRRIDITMGGFDACWTECFEAIAFQVE